MGILIISADDVAEEYDALVRFVAQHYHPDIPVQSQVFQDTVKEILIDACACWDEPPPRPGILRSLFHILVGLFRKIIQVFKLGEPPYQVILWDTDTLCLYV